MEKSTAAESEIQGGPHDTLAPTHKSWRIDETDVRVQGRWCYLYRAIDSTGATIDFMLSGLRDAAAATRLFRKALTDPSHPQHRPPTSTNSREGRDWKSVVVCIDVPPP